MCPMIIRREVGGKEMYRPELKELQGGKKIDLNLLGRQESNGGITGCTLLSMTLMQKIVMKDWPMLEIHFPR